MATAENADNSERPDNNGGSEGFGRNSQSKPENQDSTKKQDHPRDVPKPEPSIPVRLWFRFLAWKNNPDRKRAHLAEWITVFLTLVLAGTSILQLRIYRQQKEIMESSGGQTDQLIKAANIQAGAATRNADAASKNADAEDRFAKETVALVKTMNRQSAAQQGQLTLAKEIFEMEHGTPLSPEVSLFLLGRHAPHATVEFRFKTLENREATNMIVHGSAQFRPRKPPNPLDRPTVSTQTCGDIKPTTCTQTDLLAALSPEVYSDYIKGNTTLWAWGHVNYRDDRGVTQVFAFCYYVSAKDVTEAHYINVPNPVPPNSVFTGFHVCPK